MLDQLFSLVRGDSQEIDITLEHGGSAYEPPVGSTQTFTLKRLTVDEDFSALVQKTIGAGLTVDTSTATVVFVPQDTYDLEPSVPYLFDVQSQEADGKLKTVAFGSITFRGDITRQPDTSITIYTTEPTAYQSAADSAAAAAASAATATTQAGIATTKAGEASDSAAAAAASAASISGALAGYLTIAGAAAAYQPLDADLTAIAALTTTSFGRSTLTLADAAAGRTLFALGTAATRDVGQLGGNIPTLTANGTLTLGEVDGFSGVITLWDNDLNTYRTISDAAFRSVGQLAGNVPEFGADGQLTLGEDGVADGRLYLWNDNISALGAVYPTGNTFILSTGGSSVAFNGSTGKGVIFDYSANTATPRTYILPDASGTLALTSDLTSLQSKAEVKSGNFTAANDGVYTITASATVTDPTPVEGKGYTVFVRNGTLTQGANTFSTAGTILERIYHSGAWANYEYQVAGGGGGVPTSRTISTTAPLTGGGDLSADRTLALTFATNTQTVAGTSSTLPVPPSSLLLAMLNTGLRSWTLTSGTATTGSGTASVDYGVGCTLSVTNTTAGTILRRASTSTPQYTMPNLGEISINWGKPWGASVRMMASGTWAAGNRAIVPIMKGRLLTFGLTGSDPFFFVEVDNRTITAGYWSGSTATRTASLGSATNSNTFEVILIGDGAGNVAVYYNKTLAATLTSAPTATVASESTINFEMENTGAGNAAAMSLAYPFFFWSYT